MKIVYKTPEAEENHIPYEESGNFLTFDDTLTLNLAKYESDDDRHMDICKDKMDSLTTGVIPGWTTMYVAQIDIPARTYHDEETEDMDEKGEPVIKKVPDPYDPEKTTLTLWKTEE